MFNKKNNSSKNESHSSGKHPFIKNLKAKLIAERKKDIMKLIMEDLRHNNFVFSNN